MRFTSLLAILSLSALLLGCDNSSNNDGPVGPFKPPLNKLDDAQKKVAINIFSQYGSSDEPTKVVENWNRSRNPGVGQNMDPNLKRDLEMNCSYKVQQDSQGVESTYVSGAGCPIEVANVIKSREPIVNGDNVTIIMDMSNSFIAKKPSVGKVTAVSQYSLAGVSTITGSQSQGTMNIDALMQGTISFIPFPAHNEPITNAPAYMAIKVVQTRETRSSEVRIGAQVGQWYEMKVVETANYKSGERKTMIYLNDELMDKKDVGKLPTLGFGTDL